MQAKLAKDPTSAFTDVYDFAQAIRAGKTAFEDLDIKDVDIRLKWVGMLHRKKNPKTFMMRLKVPNGIINSEQLRFYADSVEPFGPKLGVVDITTRQNIQLRGVRLEAAPGVIDGLHALNQTSFHSALDNVRNLVGSPLAGIADELIDTRPFCNALNDLITVNKETGERGNPVFSNLPRKFNIAISGDDDDFSHCNINDIGLHAVEKDGVKGFNLDVGGYMSVKRVAESIPLNLWVRADIESVNCLCEAILRIFRDEGERKNRQKARLMWLVEKYGADEFAAEVAKEMDSYGRDICYSMERADHVVPAEYQRRTLLGIHAQPQDGKSRVGVHCPEGRLSASECREIADLADKYSGGEVRLTVEQNMILPNVDNDMLSALKAEPALNAPSRFAIDPGFIVGNVVSCTGAQFCGFAMITTKGLADDISRMVAEKVIVDRPIRIHWTGCPNSCGQVQAADIGLMGGPAKKLNEETGKMMAVPGVSIFVGGKIGPHASLSTEPRKKGVILENDIVVEEIVDIICTDFGGTRRTE